MNKIELSFMAMAQKVELAGDPQETIIEEKVELAGDPEETSIEEKVESPGAPQGIPGEEVKEPVTPIINTQQVTQTKEPSKEEWMDEQYRKYKELDTNIQEVYLKEKYDLKVLKWIIENFEEEVVPNLRDSVTEDEKYVKELLSKCKKIFSTVKKNGHLKVKYERSEGGGGHGRMFAKGLGGLQNMPRELRHTLAKGLYTDIDMVNAHPVLLYQLAEKNEIPCKYLKKYITHRDECLQTIMSCNPGISREDAKEIILTMINSGSKRYNDLEDKPDWLILFKDEIGNLLKQLAEKNKDIVEMRKKMKKGNLIGSVVNCILCDIEHECLMAAVYFFKRMKFNVDVWVFDGFMVERDEKNMVTEEILKDTNKFVKMVTGYDIEFVVKELDKGLEVPDDFLMTEDGNEIIIEHDKMAAIYVITKLENIVKKCNNKVFYKEDGVWMVDNSIHKNELKNFLAKHIMDINILKNARGDKPLFYSHNMNGATNIARAVIVNLPNNPKFGDTLWSSNLKTLTFNNGVYSFKERKFYQGGLPDVYSTIKIYRDYKAPTEEAIREVYEKLLDPILGNKEQQEYFLRWAARGLAGSVEEKTWGIMMGLRNSGKGVLVEAFTNAFGDYIGSFNAESWICRGNNEGDEGKKLSWVADFEYTRLNFSNEIRLIDDKGKQLVLDGTIPKKLAGGGDKINTRKLYCNLQSLKVQGRFMLMVNEINEINPPDAKETAVFFDMKTVFKKELTAHDEAINKIGNIKIMKSDDTIKTEWLKREDIIDAFTHIILSHYVDNTPSIPESMSMEVNEFRYEDSLSNKLLQRICVTNDQSSKILISDLKSIMNLFKISARKFKKEMELIGATYDYKHSMYRGVELIKPTEGSSEE